MPEIPAHRDIDEASLRARLTPWLAAKVDADVLEIGALGTPQGQGFSSETVFVDATWEIEGDELAGQFVLKSVPDEPAVFPTYDLALQFDCMRLVREHSDVPAAPVRWLEDDPAVLGKPFYVMDRVHGLVPPDNLPYTMEGWVLTDLSPTERGDLVRNSVGVLAGLHRIDAAEAGLGFLDRPRFGATGLDQALGEGEAYYRWVMGDAEHEVGRAALERLRSTMPSNPPPVGLSWGDSRIGNIMYAGVTPVAVLDWEMAALGPPEVDLAWFLYMHRFFTVGLGVPDPEGWPTEAEQISVYESLLGRGVDDLDWYLLWAAYRYGMIMVRIVHNQATVGIDPLWGPDDNLAVMLLASLL